MRPFNLYWGVPGLCALLIVASFVPAAAGLSREAPPTAWYRLSGDSSYLSGCIVGLCLCPVRLTYMAGTFGLTAAGGSVGSQVFNVSDIDWFTHFGGEVWNVITGSGTYYLQAETHRLVLDLRVDGAAPIHIDSGDVPRGGSFPKIDIGALTDTLCYQEGIGITAEPATSSIKVSIVPPSMVTWTVDSAPTNFDVVGGDLMALRASGGDFNIATSACVANDVAGTAMNYPVPFESGQAIWFLVRGLPEPGYDSGGAGQVSPRGWSIDASPNACP